MKKILNKRNIIIFTGGIGLIIMLSLPLYIANRIKWNILENKKDQVKFMNEQLGIIPEIINMSRGYIINDEGAIKNIIRINILAKDKVNSVNEAYLNQLQLIPLVGEILKAAGKNSILVSNSEFTKLSKEFNIISSTFYKMNDKCISDSNKFIFWADFPIYKYLINVNDVIDYMCIPNMVKYEKGFGF